MKKKPILERIDEVLAAHTGPMEFDALARILYPDARSWRYQANGGPPGCYMALSSAIRRGKYSTMGYGPGRKVYKRKTT